MKPLVDTGLIVALLNPKDMHHLWAKDISSANPLGFITCEAVLSEAIYILRKSERAKLAVVAMIESAWLNPLPVLPKYRSAVSRILESYHPNSDFADACLVALHEEFQVPLYTTDKRDFLVYKTRMGSNIDAIFPTE